MEGVHTDSKPDLDEYHISVMPDEVMKYLKIEPGGKYIDCTLGGGGHTIEILKRGGRVLGIDTDQDALDCVTEKVKGIRSEVKIGKDLILVRGNFRDIDKISKNNGFLQVDGILYDLGVSTHQLTTTSRGFSFKSEADLDMRMDNESGISAKEVVNTKTVKELYEIFTKYGEEKRAWTIAEAIVRARSLKEIDKTNELADIVLSVRGRSSAGYDRTHPATRVFQALRIYVNDELEGLKESLPKAIGLLKKNGNLAIISFHSLEDRIVKTFLRHMEDLKAIKTITKKPVRPNEVEISQNNSSRSGKLRVAMKII